MSRRNSALAIAIGLAISAVAAPRAVAQDAATPAEAERAVEQFSERLGLTSLRVEQLDQRLARAAGAERVEIAGRLGALYAELLEKAASPDERAHWEQRSRALLDAVPQADSFDLRLDLHRAAYIRAERLAERWRLRLADEAQRDEALRAFSDLAAELSRIGEQAHQRIQLLERQEETTRDLDPAIIGERLAAARRQRSLAMYLAGWSRAYSAEFTGDRALATEALRNFGWLLGASPGAEPTLERAQPAMFAFEHVARAAVGAAVCEAVRADGARALRWLDAVEQAADAHPAVVADLGARRMTLLARVGDMDALGTLITRRKKEAPPGGPPFLSVGEARLLAVLALEGQAGASQTDNVRFLAEVALATLTAHGEIAQVLDLASRYGAAPIGSTGFVAHHVRGLRFYEQARDAHRRAGPDPDRPTSSAEAVRLYSQAAETLRQAFDEREAETFPGARANVALMRGLSLYYGAGPGPDAPFRLVEAAAWLERASSLLEAEPARSADALSTAVRAIDEAVDRAAASSRAAAEARRDELVAAFIERFPDHDRVGAMLYRRATEGGLAPADAVDLLRRVPEHTPAWEPALRRRERLLFELREAAAPAERDWASMRYADAADNLLAIDRRRAAEGDPAAAASAAVVARRLLDALLGVANPDGVRAERALDAVESLANAGLVDGAPLREELEYRRAQIALAQGDVAKAERIADALRSPGAASDEPSTGWPAAASRLLFRHAVTAWRDALRAGAPNERVAEAARIAVRRGLRVMVDVGSDESALRDPAAFSLVATVAEAAASLWGTAHDLDARQLAIQQHRKLLAIEPNNRVLLRRMADLAEDAGDLGGALECWRTLSAGLDPGADEWFEARHRLIAILARTDVARAREVMAQHRSLHPEYGPAPWGERLRALDAELQSGAAAGGSPPR